MDLSARPLPSPAGSPLLGAELMFTTVDMPGLAEGVEDCKDMF